MTANKPAKKAAKEVRQKAGRRSGAARAPFGENEPAVAKQNKINVRAQSHINSEIVTTLKRGDTVTVLNEVTLKKPKTDEPAVWAQILLPSATHVWVNGSFLDGTNGTVKPSKVEHPQRPGRELQRDRRAAQGRHREGGGHEGRLDSY